MRYLKGFVFVTGLANVLAGPVIASIGAELLGPSVDSLAVRILLGALIAFTGLVLMWAAADIPQRLAVIVLDGALRICVAITMIWFGNAFFEAGRLQIGLSDAVVGTIYLTSAYVVLVRRKQATSN